MLKKLLTLIGFLLGKVWHTAHDKGVAYTAYWVCTYALPFVLVNEQYALVTHYSDDTRLTVFGYSAAVVVYLMLRKWMWGKTLILKPGFIKWVVCTIHRLVPLALVFMLFNFIAIQGETIHKLLVNCAIAIGFGAFFQLLYFLKYKHTSIGVK